MRPFTPPWLATVALAATIGCASGAPDPPEQPGLPPLDTVRPVPVRPSAGAPDPVREAALFLESLAVSTIAAYAYAPVNECRAHAAALRAALAARAPGGEGT